jgi:type IV pilus assembly protein PilQ
MTRKNISKTAMRGIILLLVCATARLGVASSPPATLRAVSVSTTPGANLLQLRIDGAYTFNAVQATPDTLFIDLAPATADNIAATGEWTGGLLTGYRLIQFSNSTRQPAVRLQVEMKHHQTYQVQRTGDALNFVFADTPVAASAHAVAPAPAPPTPAVFVPAAVTAPVASVPPPASKVEPAPKSNGEFAEVSGVSIKPGPAGVLYVDVATSQPTTYHVLQLSNPTRLVVDLNRAHHSLSQKTFPSKSPLLSDVRVGQFRAKDPAIVRVVADLAGDAIFDVHSQPGGIRIELKPHMTASRATKPSEPSLVAAAPTVKNEETAPLTAVEEKASQPPAVEASNPVEMVKTEPVVVPTVKNEETAPLTAVEEKASQPPAVEASNPVEMVKTEPVAVPTVKEETAPLTAVEEKASQPRAVEASNPVEMVKTEPVAAPKTETKSEVAASAHSEFQNTLPPSAGSNEVSAAPRLSPPDPDEVPESVQAAHAAKVIENSTEASMGPSPAQMGDEQPMNYTGEPISLNLKDVDLKDFFRLIHEISGLNILVDPNVTGTVTMVLDNVPWDQALDIVLKNSQLGKTLEGNVLRISKIETLTAQQAAAAKLVEAKEDAQPLVTKFIGVNYANAKNLQTLLKGWTGGGALSKRGNILVDDRTNTLIISDIATQIPILESIIHKLDTKTKQVSIEARVVLTTQLFERDLAGALNQGSVNGSGTTVTGGATGTGASVTGNIPTGGSSTRITIGQTSAVGFGAYAISNQGARYFINAMLAASEQKAESKTISKPMIVTQNNVPGTVEQGVEIPVQTSINNTVTVTYINAALTLTVTPQVTQDGNIFLIIKVDNASPGDIVTGAGISINRQSANTQVLVPDGGTVIFGGVTVNGNSKAATYVPWLGQIPILGQLFKTSQKKSNANELLFFVSPKVLPG